MTFFEAGQLLEQGKKVHNGDKRYWGDNFLYIQLVNETKTNKDLEGNQISTSTRKKIMLYESTAGLIEYTLQQEDFLSDEWEEYVEE